ncbi:MAG: argininosuccinate lyase [Candidatus Methylomirabilota bacterium]|nr:argininosuccinate lyase [candidate division NC10 bacterium]PWB47363.1 MAG: argininosuccinate lyase [candidate division NC10 bacterium]
MKTRRKAKKPWGGRFQQATDPRVEAYTASIHFDRRLYQHDIAGSIAHARMLARCGLLTRAEADKISSGLTEIGGEIERGEFRFDPSLEDIHMAIEARLIEKVGEAGAKLHTGRSRNDQVALDLRLYLREEIDQVRHLIVELERALITQAEAHLKLIMPGYTHLQRAQPILLAHHLMAYVEMLERDRERLRDAIRRVNVLPLGSGALAGVGLPIDRAFVARALRFPSLSANSLDAVSDRDFVIEPLSACALLMAHLSRLAEEIALWASAEFGFIELPDAFATGSSMMPQKKNPDIAELARGKSGRVFGALMALLTIVKGLPLSYNRDLQEDKEPLFDSVESVKATLVIMASLVRHLTFCADRMREAAEEGCLNATDLADYLVCKGMPFRQAHEVVGLLVRSALTKRCRLEDLSLQELQTASPLLEKDVFPYITLEACIERRTAVGGTATSAVKKAITAAKTRLRSR